MPVQGFYDLQELLELVGGDPLLNNFEKLAAIHDLRDWLLLYLRWHLRPVLLATYLVSDGHARDMGAHRDWGHERIWHMRIERLGPASRVFIDELCIARRVRL